DGVLSIVDHGSPANALYGRGEIILSSSALDEFVEEPFRDDVVKIRRINVLKIDQLRQQQMPMGFESGEESLPVQFRSVSQHHVVDVGSIEAFAILDKDLAPDQVFGGKELYGHTSKFSLAGVVEPGVINGANIIHGIKDDVYVVFPFEDLDQPPRIGHFSLASALLKKFQNHRVVRGFTKYIQVLGITVHARVVEGSECAAQHEIYSCFIQEFKGFTVKREGFKFFFFRYNHHIA